MNTNQFALVCKSYKGDIRRLQRLLTSIDHHNADQIPVYIILPQSDLLECQRAVEELNLKNTEYLWLTDEDVVSAHPQAVSRQLLTKYRATPGSVSQQIIKSEAWRVIQCDAYLSLDSDSIFLKDFHTSDFLSADGTPYFGIHQAKDLYQLVIDKGYANHYDDFLAIAKSVQTHFGRLGPHYSFSPQPYIWSSKVWNALHEQWFVPKKMTLWDAIEICPFEAHWYGEAFLHFKLFQMMPIEPILRVYHFDWQYDLYKKLGEKPELLTRQYLGICAQSNWEISMDVNGARSIGSSLTRKIKRAIRNL
jgi:hypothetical protein